jgi:hypothetical protein
MVGNLVLPDDLYGSAFDWYRTIKVKVLFWTVYSKTEKIFSATSSAKLVMWR